MSYQLARTEDWFAVYQQQGGVGVFDLPLFGVGCVVPEEGPNSIFGPNVSFVPLVYSREHGGIVPAAALPVLIGLRHKTQSLALFSTEPTQTEKASVTYGDREAIIKKIFELATLAGLSAGAHSNTGMLFGSPEYVEVMLRDCEIEHHVLAKQEGESVQ